MSRNSSFRFPRVKARGPIEAANPYPHCHWECAFPRVKARGPIEAGLLVAAPPGASIGVSAGESPRPH